jgi:HK97 family phage major capsid protein
MIRPGWLMHPRTWWFLWRLRDGNGNQVFRAELDRGMLAGFPVRKTTNIPINLGAGGDESEVYLVDFASIVVGETMDLEIAVADGASFVSAGGAQVNGFQSDETLVRALMQHDVNARQRGREIVVLTQVDWF